MLSPTIGREGTRSVGTAARGAGTCDPGHYRPLVSAGSVSRAPALVVAKGL